MSYIANRPAPSDQEAEAAWSEIMAIADKNALIVNAYGGVATLALPREQRTQEGLRERVLRMGRFELESDNVDA